jgi:hypothetical protein
MNTERVDMWFMPFEESHDPPMLDPTSELSSYSSVRMSPVSLDPFPTLPPVAFSFDI